MKLFSNGKVLGVAVFECLCQKVTLKLEIQIQINRKKNLLVRVGGQTNYLQCRPFMWDKGKGAVTRHQHPTQKRETERNTEQNTK